MKLPALVAIALFTAFATTLGLADAQTPGTQMAPDCAYGAYQSPSGDLIAIQPMPGNQGPKFTLLDGRRGYTRAADSPAHCENGVFVGNSASGKRFVWHRLRFRATPANFMSLGTKLHGLLLEPAGVKKPPLIVFVHGSEKYSPIRLYYQLLFTAQGVATFFYDKRGTGESQGTYTQDFSVLATDAANAARTARKIDAGRFSRLGFFGGSQGGWVAPLAALQVKADFLEVGFGCVCTPLEQDQWQVDYQLVREDGFAPSILPQVHDVTAVTAQVIGSRSPQFGLLGKLKTKYGAAPWFSRIDGQYSGEMLHEDGRKPWLVGVRLGIPWHYSGLSTLRRLTIPQLWVFAQNDSIAPSANSIARLRRLNAAHAVRSIVVFPDTDHGIYTFHIDGHGQQVENSDVANGYFRLLGDYAKGTVAGGYGNAHWVTPKTPRS